MENVLNGLDFLRTEGGCCDSFTILVQSSQRQQVIEVKTIPGPTLLRLCSELDEFCGPSDTKPGGWTIPLANTCLTILGEIGWNELASTFLKNSLGSGKTPSPSRCLHLCALITQIASVSLVTYSRGHSREFYTTCITRPIDVFILGGLTDYGPSIYAERVELACMGKMLGRKVWMFHQDKKAIGTFRTTFFLATTIENLLDTWGGWVYIQKDGKGSEIRLHVGGGVITAVQNDDVGIDLIAHDEIYCHWSSELDAVPPEQKPISSNARLLIGATCVNKACLLTIDACQAAIAKDLDYMGTRPPSWKDSGRTAGFSGGQWFNVNMSRSLTKDDGRNLKGLLIDRYRQFPDLRKLNSPWGLELSLCTGIARRVLLRNLIYGEALEYLKLGLQIEERSEIETIVSTISEISDNEFAELLKNLTKPQDEALKKATELLLLVMESTGVGEDGHTLTLWWPESTASDPRGLKILKSQYSGTNPWIPMIKDSEHCAVFGLATARCLQHDDVKRCQQHDPLQTWKAVENIIFDTTLTPADSEFASFSYCKDSRYLLWKRRDILQVTRPRPDAEDAGSGAVHLRYSPGLWPPIVLNRLKGKLEKVKEKQGIGDPGQGVLIL